MDLIDKELLSVIQGNFPVQQRPFDYLAKTLGITEDEVINRISRLKEDGIIRRIGGVFDSKKLGYYSTLCALEVSEDKLEEVSDMVNSITGVTHNYIRDNRHNMWFTLIGPSEDYINSTLEELTKHPSINDLINLPSVRTFKINVNFDLRGV